MDAKGVKLKLVLLLMGSTLITDNVGSTVIGRTCKLVTTPDNKQSTDVINGGFSNWTEWGDCSVNCGGIVNRSRVCNSPYPRNGGLNCSGADHETKRCGPVNGNWTGWGKWSPCSVTQYSSNTTALYGEGTSTRWRYCSDPPPICGGQCIGSENETKQCVVTPACLTEMIFKSTYTDSASPMLVYSSAKVVIETQTQNLCFQKTTIYYDWQLYLYSLVGGKVTEIDMRKNGSKHYFLLRPGDLQPAIYRLYVKIGYPNNFTHWMEDSMFIKIENLPPNTFITGGTGRIIGAGLTQFDGRSQSYSLKNSPGDPSGLVFSWACLRYVTYDIYYLLSLYVDPKFVFGDHTYPLKWYDTSLLEIINDLVKAVNGTLLLEYVKQQPIYGNTAENLYVTFTQNFSSTHIGNGSVNISIPDDLNCTHFLINETSALTDFFDIKFMSNMVKNREPKLQENIFLPEGHEQMTKDFLAVKNKTFYSNETFLMGIKDVGDFLSDSYSLVYSLNKLRNVSGVNFDSSFLSDMTIWLVEVDKVTNDLNSLCTVISEYKNELSNIEAGWPLINYVGIQGYLRLYINRLPQSSRKYLLQFLYTLYDTIFRLKDYDWNWIEEKEKMFINWMVDILVVEATCSDFMGTIDGFANLSVTQQNVLDGYGYLVYLRADDDGSVEYFIQHTQTISGDPPELELQCRLNCMKKTAISSMMSLVAVCTSCTNDEVKHATFSWELRRFNITSRISEGYKGWQDMMLTDLNSPKFVMKSGLPENQGFIVKASIKLASGRYTQSIWLITTDFVPYGGKCTVKHSSSFADQYEVHAIGWKDEGFRIRKDYRVDWKEQLNYRIDQVNNAGSSILYYGDEELSSIKIKPGLIEDNYTVTLEVQIYDIFKDYAKCYVTIPNVKPPVDRTMDNDDLNRFIKKSNDDIDYHYNTGNYKLVAMNTEVVGATVMGIDIPDNGLDLAPSNWTKLGRKKLENGTVQRLSFDDLWNAFNNQSQEQAIEIIQQAMDNYTSILDNVSYAVSVESLTNIRQLCNSIGTVINNKDYVVRSAAWMALEGNKKMVNEFIQLSENDTYPKYEDYIHTSEDILRVLSNSLDGVTPELSADLPSDINIYSMQDQLSLLGTFETDATSENDVNDLTSAERAYIATQLAMKAVLVQNGFQEEAQKATTSIFDTVSSLGPVLEVLNYRKQLPVYVRKKGISTSMDKKLVSEILNNGIAQDSISLEFDSKNIPTHSASEERVQLTVFDKNPFSWDPRESKYITSKIVTSSIGISALPSKLRFKNTISAGKLFQLAIPTDVDDVFTTQVFYKMYWRNHADSLIVFIDNACSSLAYLISLKQYKKPTDVDFDWRRQVMNKDWKTENSFSILVDGGLYDKSSIVHIRIHISRVASDKSRQRRRALGNNMTFVDTIIFTSTTACRVWNNVTQTWNTSSCRLSSNSTIYETICLCTNPPGNSFATTFYVPPNMIDFSSVFTKFEISNSAVLFTIVGVIVLFIMLCICAVRGDKRDPDKWAISYLMDNFIEDEYLYMVTVYTGLRKNAGTKSNVRFVIVGDQVTTDVRYLDDGNKKGFGLGSTRRFVMSVPKKVGNPNYMSVWHDNTGEGSLASWYLNKIVLEDIQTSEQHIFIFEEWLSIDDCDGKIRTIAPVNGEKGTNQFSFLFNEQTREGTTDNHLWLSVCLRPEPSHFTRVKRLSCCFSLLFLTMITNAMFYGQETESHQTSFGPIKFSFVGVYVSLSSILITIPPLFFITFLFKNSRPLQDKREKLDIEKFILQPKDDSLHAGFQILAWVLVILSVVVSGFFVILYSMEWGKSKSEEWLLSFLLSFLESILIVDPLKIIILASVFAYITTKRTGRRRVVKFDRELILAETKKRANSPMNKLLDTFRKDTLMPLDDSTIKNLKIRRQQVIRAEQILVELLVYVAFLFTLYVISYSNRDVKWYTSNLHLRQHLVDQQQNGINKITGTQKFDNVSSNNIKGTPKAYTIKSSAEFYSWLNDTLIPFVFPEKSVMKGKLTAYDRQFTSDLSNFRNGPIRLRQLRIPEGDCSVDLTIADMTCIDKYSVLKEDENNYCVGWESLPCPTREAVYNITSNAWKFTPAVDLWGLPTIGYHTTYGGGGYVADLGVNNALSRQIINDLYKYVWIDRNTRAVFAEFTLYNANENVFLYISFLCEFLEFGSVLLTPSIQPFRPYQHVGNFGLIVLVCEVLVLLASVIFSIKMIYEICKQRRNYFTSRWCIVDVIIVIICYVGFIMYIGRCLMISKCMDAFHDNKHRFINFGHLATWDEMLNVVLSFLIFLTTVRLMRVLSYNSRITQLSDVLSHVFNELFGCLVLFFIVYMAFVCFGHLVFGRHLEDYKSLLVSMTTITNAIIGRNSINTLFWNDPVLGRIYYFLFVLFVIWILMTMLCATLNTGIFEVKQSSKHLPAPYGIVNVTERFINQTFGLLRPSTEDNTSEFNFKFLTGFGSRHSKEKQAHYKCNRLGVSLEIIR